MTTIIKVHEVYEEKLAGIVEEMRALGAPTIHAVWSPVYDAWVALEGTHRITAAAVLGLTPEIIEVEYSDAEMRSFGWSDIEDGTTVEYLCDTASGSYNAGLFHSFENLEAGC